MNADAEMADLSAELRQLIAQSRPSAVRSAARASLLSPSRPSTPSCESPSRGALAEGSATYKAQRCKGTQSARRSFGKSGGTQECRRESIEREEMGSTEEEAKKGTRQDKHLLLQEHTALQVLANVDEACRDLAGACSSTIGFARIWSLVDGMCACAEKKGETIEYRVRVAATQQSLVEAAIDLLQDELQDVCIQLRAARLVLRTATTKSCSRNGIESVCCQLRGLASSGRQYDDFFRSERVLEAVVHYLFPAGSSDSSSSLCKSTIPGTHFASEEACFNRLSGAMAFALGAVALVSSRNVKNQQALAACGAVSRVAQLINARKHSISSPVLVEAIALLRCLVDDKRSTHLFWTANVPASLCACLARFPHEAELALNCVRVLAKLTMTARGRKGVSAGPLLAALSAFHEDADGAHMALCVRACFVLGNLTLESETARQEALSEVKLLSSLAQLHWNWRAAPSRRRRKEQQDMLIYLVRVLANLCLDCAAGPALLNAVAGAEGRHCVRPLVAILAACNDEEASAREDAAEAFKTEELALNLLACLANLSFHDEKGLLPHQPGAVHAILAHLQDDSHPEAAVEALRALGNVSRTNTGRNELVRAGADARCLQLLQVRESKSVERSLVLGCCGVLTNMMSVAETHALASSRGDMRGLLHRLRRAGTSDAEVSLRACMVIHNFALMDARAFRSSAVCAALVPVLKELIDIGGDMEDDEEWDTDEALSRFVEVGRALLGKCVRTGNSR